jgi:hypothetical protein
MLGTWQLKWVSLDLIHCKNRLLTADHDKQLPHLRYAHVMQELDDQRDFIPPTLQPG